MAHPHQTKYSMPGPDPYSKVTTRPSKHNHTNPPNASDLYSQVLELSANVRALQQDNAQLRRELNHIKTVVNIQGTHIAQVDGELDDLGHISKALFRNGWKLLDKVHHCG